MTNKVFFKPSTFFFLKSKIFGLSKIFGRLKNCDFETLPERIYNPITATGFWAMFTSWTLRGKH
jgi:hypothetical protein